MIKQEIHTVTGMQRDLTVSKFKPEFVFDAQNIRITARENSTLLSVTNEKGNNEIILYNEKNNIVKIKGTVIGYNVLNEYLTLFTTDTSDVDRIYRINKSNNKFICKCLIEESLGFNIDNPIQTIGIYENDKIQKVYWIADNSQPRVINIVSDKPYTSSTDFDFIQTLKLEENIKIVRIDSGGGEFAPGVIQYSFTYYNKYGQESNIFYTSPLNYISFSDRGASPEEKVSNSFRITINNIKDKFDFLRIYSIHRTSLESVPTVKNVIDIPIKGRTSLEYVDDGTTGALVDSSELLYIGGEPIAFKAIAHKDNTLFLGNATLQRELISDTIKNAIKEGTNITFTLVEETYDNNISSAYYYKNQLSDLKGFFKGGEYYRFGIQLQDKYGKWSEPIFIKDTQNTIYPIIDEHNPNIIHTPRARITISNDVLNTISSNYINIRGVVVYPTLNDREVIAQGVICPTMFNAANRFSNAPFAQSSWFSRPNSPFDIEMSEKDWTLLNGSTNYEDTKAAILSNDKVDHNGITIDTINKGAWAEFRNYRQLPPNNQRNAEIQCIIDDTEGNEGNESIFYPYIFTERATKFTDSEVATWVASNAEKYYIDQSIITLHSPDIEFNEQLQNLDTKGLKLRIIGMVPITANSSDIDIQTSTSTNLPPRLSKEFSPLGFYKEYIGSDNISMYGWKGLVSGAFWFDIPTYTTDRVIEKYNTGYVIYPWHRNGSLNNDRKEAEHTVSSLLSQKKISNLRFSAYTKYFASDSARIWNAEISEDPVKTGISGVKIFNNNSIIQIPAPKNSDLPNLNYYGNVDQVVALPRIGDKKQKGYPIVITGRSTTDNAHKIFTGKYWPNKDVPKDELEEMEKITYLYGEDPVSIKYNSTPHAVMALNYTKDHQIRVLPTIKEHDDTHKPWDVNPPKQWYHPKVGKEEGIPFWDKNRYTTGISYDTIDVESNYGWLWLGEIYNDTVANRFGGEYNDINDPNIWIPASEPIKIREASKGIMCIGDTYLQRYDCLKTYSPTTEEQNSVVEILSFMCETRINIDGRYDRNRGQVNNLVANPRNFNLINTAYTQKNNFFNYRTIDYERFKLSYFPNTITWTKEKHSNALIDTWTNITMASTLDLDGDKGEVVSINTFNNELFCFQKRALSNLLFNSRVQIPTSDNTPIEITNGLKMGGKRYVSNSIGCNNKWSITESPNGIYFIDNITNSIYLFNGQISSLSDKLGFRQWIGENNSELPWTPKNFNNFITFYDKNNDDVYFVNKNTSLVYSELLGQFTSFIDYGNTQAMFNIGSDFYAIYNNTLWEQFAGEYNYIYNEYKPYSITFISNAEESVDKIFNTIEYRADRWDNSLLVNKSPFNKLEVWNEYQKGVTSLDVNIAKPSPLKRKFRVWRTTVPRFNTDWNGIKANNRDRIRNTWAYIRLSNTEDNTDRAEIHDTIVHYFI